MTRVATAQDSEVLLISTTVYNDNIIMHASRNLLREQQAVMHNAYDISYNQSVSLPVLLNENLVYTPVAYTALLRDIYIYFEAYICSATNLRASAAMSSQTQSYDQMYPRKKREQSHELIERSAAAIRFIYTVPEI